LKFQKANLQRGLLHILEVLSQKKKEKIAIERKIILDIEEK